MDTINTVSKFNCPIHPSNSIQRISLDPSSTSSLYYIECVISGVAPQDKHSLVTLPTLIDKAYAYYSEYSTSKSVASSAPSDLGDFLSTEKEVIDGFAAHVELEKTKVTEDVDRVLGAITDLLMKRRDQLHRALDKELYDLKTNYAYYKTKIAKFYRDEHTNKAAPVTKEGHLREDKGL